MKREIAAQPSTDQLKQSVQTEKESYQRKVFGLDLLFLMDCTGSMGPWINQAKDKIFAIIEAATKIDKRVYPRVGFVGYRDYGDQDSMRYFIIDFTEKPSEIQNKVFFIFCVNTVQLANCVASNTGKILTFS